MAAAHLSLSCFLNLRFRFSINLPASLRFELETLTEPYESACDHLRQIASVRGVANNHQQFEALQDALYAYLQHLTAGYLCFVLLSIRPHPFFPDDLNPVAPIFILDRIFHPGDPLQEVEEEQNEQTGQSCTVERLYQHSPQVIALKEMVVNWVQNLIGDIRRESHQLNHQDYYDDWQQEAIHWAEESTVMTEANRFMACLQEMAAAQQTAINAFAQRAEAHPGSQTWFCPSGFKLAVVHAVRSCTETTIQKLSGRLPTLDRSTRQTTGLLTTDAFTRLGRHDDIGPTLRPTSRSSTSPQLTRRQPPGASAPVVHVHALSTFLFLSSISNNSCRAGFNGRTGQLITSKSTANRTRKSMSDTEEHKNETLGNEEQNKPASEFVENPGGSAASPTVASVQHGLEVAVAAPTGPAGLEDDQEDSPAAVPMPSPLPLFSPPPPQPTTSDQDLGTSSTLPTTEQLQASYHLLWEAIHKHFTVPTEWAMVAIRSLVSAIKRRAVGGQEPNLPELQKQFDKLVNAVAAFSLLLREVIHQQVDTRSFTTPLASSSSSSMSYYANILPPLTPRIKWASLAEYVDALEAQMLKLFDAGQEDDDENGNAEDAGPEHAFEDVLEEEEDEGRLRQLKENFCLAVETMITSLGPAICELNNLANKSGGSTITTTSLTPMTPETLSKGFVDQQTQRDTDNMEDDNIKDQTISYYISNTANGQKALSANRNLAMSIRKVQPEVNCTSPKRQTSLLGKFGKLMLFRPSSNPSNSSSNNTNNSSNSIFKEISQIEQARTEGKRRLEVAVMELCEQSAKMLEAPTEKSIQKAQLKLANLNTETERFYQLINRLSEQFAQLNAKADQLVDAQLDAVPIPTAIYTSSMLKVLPTTAGMKVDKTELFRTTPPTPSPGPQHHGTPRQGGGGKKPTNRGKTADRGTWGQDKEGTGKAQPKTRHHQTEKPTKNARQEAGKRQRSTTGTGGAPDPETSPGGSTTRADSRQHRHHGQGARGQTKKGGATEGRGGQQDTAGGTREQGTTGTTQRNTGPQPGGAGRGRRQGTGGQGRTEAHAKGRGGNKGAG
ncbi:hypothetical protein TYRP_008559 [Tyrophagus putrescentiae]|nr:hypothetical protein TYRP_008559 [Tyrophagus putrescentiae]